jgi:hypothetical protein
MRMLLFILTFVISGMMFAQKVKDRDVSIKYSKAALTPRKDLPKKYHFIVTEEDITAQGKRTTLHVRSQTNAYDIRSNFYKGDAGLGQINGFTDISFHRDSLLFFIKMDVGLLDDGIRSIVNGSSPSGIANYHYSISFRLPISFTVMLPDSSIIYERSTKDTTFKYAFPKDYKPTAEVGAYFSHAELGAAYQTHHYGFFTEIRNTIVKNWVYQTKMDFSSRFGRQLTDMKVDLHFIKDKKGSYDDVDLLVVKMDTLFNQLDANYENSYIKNWHQTRYKAEFEKLASEWETLLNADLEKSKSGNPARFDTEAKWGLYKNQLWCKFFAGEMDFVIEKCTQLELDRKTNEMIYEGVKFENLRAIASDYRIRYLANPELFRGN